MKKVGIVAQDGALSPRKATLVILLIIRLRRATLLLFPRDTCSLQEEEMYQDLLRYRTLPSEDLRPSEPHLVPQGCGTTSQPVQATRTWTGGEQKMKPLKAKTVEAAARRTMMRVMT